MAAAWVTSPTMTASWCPASRSTSTRPRTCPNNNKNTLLVRLWLRAPSPLHTNTQALSLPHLPHGHVHRRLASASSGLVHDIIMHQHKEVLHFNTRRKQFKAWGNKRVQHNVRDREQQTKENGNNMR